MDRPVKKVWVARVTIMVLSLKLEMIQPLNMPRHQPMTAASRKPIQGLVWHQP